MENGKHAVPTILLGQHVSFYNNFIKLKLLMYLTLFSEIPFLIAPLNSPFLQDAKQGEGGKKK